MIAPVVCRCCVLRRAKLEELPYRAGLDLLAAAQAVQNTVKEKAWPAQYTPIANMYEDDSKQPSPRLYCSIADSEFESEDVTPKLFMEAFAVNQVQMQGILNLKRLLFMVLSCMVTTLSLARHVPSPL